MGDVAGMLFWLILGATTGCFCAWLARERGRNPGGWFVLGFFFSFVALLTLIGAPDRHAS